jgi:hypothetical protein
MKEGKTMITGNFVRGSLASEATENQRQFSEIAHDLKNCMSILFYWAETLERDAGRSLPDEDSIEDLKKLIHKTNGLLQELVAR